MWSREETTKDGGTQTITRIGMWAFAFSFEDSFVRGSVVTLADLLLSSRALLSFSDCLRPAEREHTYLSVYLSREYTNETTHLMAASSDKEILPVINERTPLVNGASSSYDPEDPSLPEDVGDNEVRPGMEGTLSHWEQADEGTSLHLEMEDADAGYEPLSMPQSKSVLITSMISQY